MTEALKSTELQCLTTDQSKAIAAIDKFLVDPIARSFVLVGGAGTGKTTLLKAIKERLGDRCVIGAPTNKAVSVLRHKGFTKATTLDRIVNKTVCEIILRAPNAAELAYYKEHDITPIPEHIEEKEYSKIDSEETGLLVCIDESSMTNQSEFEKVTALYKKVLWVGDGYQLPPVEGEEWFQTVTPDAVLTEVVRTAAQSEITQCAHLLRRKSPEWKKRDWQTEVSVISRTDHKAVNEAIKIADIVLCHKNQSCDWNNMKARELRGLMLDADEYKPVRGDKLLAWDTLDGLGLIKSEIYDVLGAHNLNGGYYVKLGNIRADVVKVKKSALMEQKSSLHVPGMVHMSYAHAITVHKSQGSEWDRVVVLAHDHSIRFDDHWNWLYTAATRAKKHLTLVV